MDQSIKRIGSNKTKKNKNNKVKKFAFFKTVNFKVINSIRNQVKYPKNLRLSMFLLKVIRTCPYSFL